jgi:hypothetical protein
MRTLLFIFASTVLVTGTVAGGWWHGKSASRWGHDALLQIAAKELSQALPARTGNWRVISETPLEKEALQTLQCPAHLNRTYLNEQTGDTVSVFVIVGPPGPIAAHTPDICYSSSDYALSAEKTVLAVHDQANRDHSFWQMTLRPNDATRAPLRVFYAWGTGHSWTATKEPRFSHAGAPYLYKIQLAGPEQDAAREFDACLDFLKCFLPGIQTHLVSPQGREPSTPSVNS